MQPISDCSFALQVGQPSHINSHHWQEWLSSGVDPSIITLNVKSLAESTPYDYLCSSDRLERRNDGRLTDALLRRYAHIEAGGWWCSGLDPLNHWEPMLWGCFKPNRPRIDFEHRKPIKYEHPAKTGTRAFFLDVPQSTWWRVASRYQRWLPDQQSRHRQILLTLGFLTSFFCTALDLPIPEWQALPPGFLPAEPATEPDREAEDLSFWQWVLDHPDIPIVIVEGAKKAGCLLSLGFVAIALPGIFNGRRVTRDESGKVWAETLIPELEPFAVEGRSVYFCFDHDTKPKTIKNVNTAIAKTGKLLADWGCEVKVIRLPGPEKGVDDFVVAQGAAAFAPLYEQALPLKRWQWRIQKEAELTYVPWLRLDAPELIPAIFPEACQNSLPRESFAPGIQPLDPDFELDFNELLSQRSSASLASTLPIAPQIPAFPERDILAIASGKGTGKSKLITQIVADSAKVLLLTHRTCLGRSLTERMQLTWRTDADKANGQWIANGEQATYRLGLCVDSLLSIDPTQFQDCDLVIDEVCQVLRHLLTSDTCRKDGKRPALLARLTCLIRVARRVIVADADLNDATIGYIRALRGESAPVYLIRNDYKPSGYPIRFIHCSNDSAITAEMLDAIRSGQKVLLQTDSKEYADAIAAILLEQEVSFIKITSDTSGNADEIDFVRSINDRVTHYQVVIATPSMATGVSIEVDHFDQVFGAFFGTVTDADAAQALGRVRAPVPRVVWCVDRGKNFSPIDRSVYPQQIQKSLKTKWDQEAALIRSSLGLSELLPHLDNGFQWEHNPHLDLFLAITADANRSMWQLRDNLLARLEYEGNHLEEVYKDMDRPVKNRVTEAKQQNWETECQLRSSARILSATERADLEGRESLSLDDKRALEKARIADFYAVEPDAITPELVDFDDKGNKRGQLAKLEMLLYPALAAKKTTDAIAKQAAWKQGLWLPDLPTAEAERAARVVLGILPFLVPGQEWHEEDLEPLGQLARQYASDVKRWLGFSIPADPKVANSIWIFRRMLHQLGIVTQAKRKTRQQIRSVWIDLEAWEEVQAILARRHDRRETLTAKASELS